MAEAPKVVEMDLTMTDLDLKGVSEGVSESLKPELRKLVVKTVVVTGIVIFSGLALRRLIRTRIEIPIPASEQTVVVEPDAG